MVLKVTEQGLNTLPYFHIEIPASPGEGAGAYACGKGPRTLCLWKGEVGRSPERRNRAAGARSHTHTCVHTHTCIQTLADTPVCAFSCALTCVPHGLTYTRAHAQVHVPPHTCLHHANTHVHRLRGPGPSSWDRLHPRDGSLWLLWTTLLWPQSCGHFWSRALVSMPHREPPVSPQQLGRGRE